MNFFYKNRLLLLFISVSLVISSFYIDLWSNGNTSARVLPVVSFIDDGTMHLDKNEKLAHDKCFVNGHFYSDKAPLPTYSIIPVIALLNSAGLLPVVDHSVLTPELYAICGFLGSTIPFLGILILSFLGLKKATSKEDPFIILTVFLSSFVFIYVGTFFGHIYSAFFLLLAYSKLKDQSFIISGLSLGAAFASEYTLGLIGLIWGLQLLFKSGWRSAFLFSIGTLPGIVFIMSYNYYYTGSPFDMLYKFVPPGYDFMKDNYGMVFPTFESIWGLSFSPYRGMFFYTPVLLIIAFFAIKKFFKSSLKEILLNPLVLPVIFSFVLISSYTMWWGGWSWGPRHLVAVTILLLYQGLILLQQSGIKKYILLPICAIGIIINLMAKITVQYSMPTEVQNPIKELWVNNLAKGFTNPNTVTSYFWETTDARSAMIFVSIILFSLTLLFFVQRKWSDVQEN